MICTHISSFGAKFDKKSRNLGNSYFERGSVTPPSRCHGRPAGRSATPICHARKKCFSQNRGVMKDIDLKLHPASSFDDMHPYLEFWREIRSKISKSRKNVFRALQRDTPVTLSRPAGRSVGHPYMSRTKKNVFLRIDVL